MNLAFLLCNILFVPCLALGASPNAPLGAIMKNKTALRDLESGRTLEANKKLSDAAVDYPTQAELFYNLAQTYEVNEEKEKATQSYMIAAELAQEPELKFQSYFNAARILGEMKQIEPAINLYQKALDIRPDSIEAKTNIELLFQSGGGGSGGDQQQQKQQEDKDDKSEDGQDQKDQKDQKDQQKPKPKPRPFQSGELSPQDAKKILDELKRQEEQVRAKFNEKRVKETPVDKDW